MTFVLRDMCHSNVVLLSDKERDERESLWLGQRHKVTHGHQRLDARTQQDLASLCIRLLFEAFMLGNFFASLKIRSIRNLTTRARWKVKRV